jgi:hypothetical protein
MNGLFRKIITRVLPRDMPTPVGRWRNEHYTIKSPVGTWMIQEKPQSPVGRWSLETCDNKINARIDRSNEDHCGPCGRNAIQ